MIEEKERKNKRVRERYKECKRREQESDKEKVCTKNERKEKCREKLLRTDREREAVREVNHSGR